MRWPLRASLRIGHLMSAAGEYLNPALAALRSPPVKWDLQVAWQRGKIAEPVRDLVNLLTRK